MEQFEGVDLDQATDINKLIVEQLSSGIHRGKMDDSPGDWIVRAWYASPAPVRRRIEDGIHKALLNPSSNVRVGALRILDTNAKMHQANSLINIAENHIDLFKGLRSTTDPLSKDRGKDFIQLVSSKATGARGEKFRRSMALDPTYGSQVLASLARQDTTWVINNIEKLVNPTIDPKGTRLGILVFNLRYQEKQLQKLITNLVNKEPTFRGKLKTSLTETVKDAELRAILLSKLI